MDVAAAVLGLHHNKIPPAVNTRNLCDGIKLNVAAEAREAAVDISVSTVYSLGGQNAALVLKAV